MTVTRIGPTVPPCAGDPQWTGIEPDCRIRTRHMVIGSDLIHERLAMVVVGACPLHLESIQTWLSTPHGAMTVDATPEALAAIVAGCREDGEDVWVMDREQVA